MIRLSLKEQIALATGNPILLEGIGRSVTHLPDYQPMFNLAAATHNKYLAAKALKWLCNDGLLEASQNRDKLTEEINAAIAESNNIIATPQNRFTQDPLAPTGTMDSVISWGKLIMEYEFTPRFHDDQLVHAIDLFNERARNEKIITVGGQRMALGNFKINGQNYLDYWDEKYEPKVMTLYRGHGKDVEYNIEQLNKHLKAHGFAPFKYGGLNGFFNYVEKGDWMSRIEADQAAGSSDPYGRNGPDLSGARLEVNVNTGARRVFMVGVSPGHTYRDYEQKVTIAQNYMDEAIKKLVKGGRFDPHEFAADQEAFLHMMRQNKFQLGHENISPAARQNIFAKVSKPVEIPPGREEEYKLIIRKGLQGYMQMETPNMKKILELGENLFPKIEERGKYTFYKLWPEQQEILFNRIFATPGWMNSRIGVVSMLKEFATAKPEIRLSDDKTNNPDLSNLKIQVSRIWSNGENLFAGKEGGRRRIKAPRHIPQFTGDVEVQEPKYVWKKLTASLYVRLYTSGFTPTGIRDPNAMLSDVKKRRRGSEQEEEEGEAEEDFVGAGDEPKERERIEPEELQGNAWMQHVLKYMEKDQMLMTDRRGTAFKVKLYKDENNQEQLKIRIPKELAEAEERGLPVKLKRKPFGIMAAHGLMPPGKYKIGFNPLHRESQWESVYQRLQNGFYGQREVSEKIGGRGNNAPDVGEDAPGCMHLGVKVAKTQAISKLANIMPNMNVKAIGLMVDKAAAGEGAVRALEALHMCAGFRAFYFGYLEGTPKDTIENFDESDPAIRARNWGKTVYDWLAEAGVPPEDQKRYVALAQKLGEHTPVTVQSDNPSQGNYMPENVKEAFMNNAFYYRASMIARYVIGKIIDEVRQTEMNMADEEGEEGEGRNAMANIQASQRPERIDQFAQNREGVPLADIHAALRDQPDIPDEAVVKKAGGRRKKGAMEPATAQPVAPVQTQAPRKRGLEDFANKFNRTQAAQPATAQPVAPVQTQAPRKRGLEDFAKKFNRTQAAQPATVQPAAPAQTQAPRKYGLEDFAKKFNR